MVVKALRILEKNKYKSRKRINKKERLIVEFLSFLENNSPSGEGARIMANIPYSNNTLVGAIAQPCVVSPSVTNSMFNSLVLSLLLLYNNSFMFLILFTYLFVLVATNMLVFMLIFFSNNQI